MKLDRLKQNKYQIAIEKFNSGELQEAEIILKNLVSKAKTDFDAYNFLGIIKLTEKKYFEAIDFFEKVLELKPNHPNVRYNYGLCLQAVGEIEKAIFNYEKFLSQNKANADVLINLGLLYVSKEEYDWAEAKYKEGIEIFPEEPRLLLNYSNLLLAKARNEEVINLCPNPEKLLTNTAFQNELIGYIINKSKALVRIKQIEEALKQLLSLYLIAPNIPDISLNIANVFLIKNENEKAREYFLKLVDTNLAGAGFNGLGLIELRKMETEKAEHHFRQAIKKEPDTPDFHYNLSHTLLIEGNLAEGFREYSWRMKRDEFIKREFSRPELIHEDVYHKRILIWDEQGIGDIIQFIRYAKLLKQRGAEVYFHCAANVVSLFENFQFIDKIIPRNATEEPQIDYDYQISLLNLPNYFGTTIESIPDKDKYIDADANLVQAWKNYFSQFAGRKVGIVWAGNPKHNNDKNRSIRLSEFARLFENKDCTFFALQKGFGIEQAEEFNSKVIILDSQIKSLNDTTAIIENLDLVITVDTSVVHLAGALGKETWLLLPFSPDWRWIKDINYSPWYNSVKIFRQSKPMQWNDVFEAVDISLKNKKTAEIISDNRNQRIENPKLYLGLTSGENFGWGVCSKYLKKELASNRIAESLEEYYSNTDEENIEGKIFHGLTDLEFNSIYKVRGSQNYGYTFFENELLPTSVENSKKYDLVIGGSTWCKEKMEAKGINNTDVLIQGIDPDMFYPVQPNKNENLFVIFSGGKFELRKGQDLVLAAVKHIMQKYNNVILINAWYNFWAKSLNTMVKSRYINFEATSANWNELMQNVYRKNGLDASRIFTLPITPNEKLRELYSKTDIGLFPNRCEGGTNLVMMEYMACGLPVIASYNSGHKDIINENNSIPLMSMKEFRIFDNNNLIADWEEPELDEIISKLEFAYEYRNGIRKIGENAGKCMMNFTWSKTSKDLLKIVDIDA